MIAYHFPPFSGSSGVQRTLRFVQQLPRFGWQPIVLTVHPRAYEKTSTDLLSDIPEGVVVERAFALDTARHLAVAGRYPGMLARPDRWISWWLGAVPAGLRLIHRHRPAVLWSTYPIATAHQVANRLHRMSGVPWVADFRDPMAQDGYPEDPRTWAMFERIERAAVAEAACSVFTTRGAGELYKARYPEQAGRIRVIENGYDEETFTGIGGGAPLQPGRTTLLHSGVIYPVERDPTHLFEALGTLSRSGRISSETLRIRFRAPSHEKLILAIAERLGVSEFVECLPPVPYREALGEMMSADGLLVMQAANCNEQIPAKVYEYLRSQRPILGLTDPVGDTADLMVRAGVRHIARLDSSAEIAATLLSFLEGLRDGTATPPTAELVAKHSRLTRTAELAGVLDQIVRPSS